MNRSVISTPGVRAAWPGAIVTGPAADIVVTPTSALFAGRSKPAAFLSPAQMLTTTFKMVSVHPACSQQIPAVELDYRLSRRVLVRCRAVVTSSLG